MADHTPTFADICSAIVEGNLAATMDGTMYSVNAFELRRYLNKFRSLPTISTAPQPRSSDSESSDWSDTVRTSVA